MGPKVEISFNLGMQKDNPDTLISYSSSYSLKSEEKLSEKSRSSDQIKQGYHSEGQREIKKEIPKVDEI
jgi:hypothetical protein